MYASKKVFAGRRRLKKLFAAGAAYTPPPPLTHQKTDVPSLSAPAHLKKALILKAEKVN